MSKNKIVKVDDIKTDAEAIKCPVKRSRYLITEFLRGPMCGRCFPCSMGSYEMKILLNNLIKNQSSQKQADRIKTISNEMLVASMCKKGKDIAKYILEWMKGDTITTHLEGICPDKKCKSMIEFRIIAEKCTMCGDCLPSCKYHAIHGEKIKPLSSGYHPFEIRQQKCVKCRACLSVCPAGAIILIDAKADKPVEV